MQLATSLSVLFALGITSACRGTSETPSAAHIADSHADRESLGDRDVVAHADPVRGSNVTPPSGTTADSIGDGDTLSGRVVDRSGAPVKGALVYSNRCWMDMQDREFDVMELEHREVETGADGTFVLGPIGAGERMVSADSDHPALTSDVTFVRGNTHGIELVLEPYASISGHIDGPSGVRPRGVHVWLFGEVGGRSFTESLEVETDGDFANDELSRGAYSLYACDADGNCAGPLRVKLRPGKLFDGIVMQLEPGARLTLRYETEAENNSSFEIWRDGKCVAFAETDEEELEPVVSVAPGELTVKLTRVVQAGEHWKILPRIEKRVTVKLGETTSVVFTDG